MNIVRPHTFNTRMYFILSSIYNVLKSLRPKHVACVDKMSEICRAWWEATVYILIRLTNKGMNLR